MKWTGDDREIDGRGPSPFFPAEESKKTAPGHGVAPGHEESRPGPRYDDAEPKAKTMRAKKREKQAKKSPPKRLNPWQTSVLAAYALGKRQMKQAIVERLTAQGHLDAVAVAKATRVPK